MIATDRDIARLKQAMEIGPVTNQVVSADVTVSKFDIERLINRIEADGAELGKLRERRGINAEAAMIASEEVAAPYGIATDEDVAALLAAISMNCRQYLYLKARCGGLPIGWKTYELSQETAAQLANRIVADQAKTDYLKRRLRDESHRAQELTDAIIGCNPPCGCGNALHLTAEEHDNARAERVWFDREGDVWLLCNQCMVHCAGRGNDSDDQTKA